MARWGVATIVNGQVAGVSGSYRLRRLAEREARRRRDAIDLGAKPVEGFRVVRRSSSRSGDWGVRPAREPVIVLDGSPANGQSETSDTSELVELDQHEINR